MKLFLDTEFTGLHKKTTLISLALVSEQNHEFYAEFTDYNLKQAHNEGEWLQKNVLEHRKFHTIIEKHYKHNKNMSVPPMVTNKGVLGNTKFIKAELEKYLATFDEIEIWSDCLSYDWVLFCDLWGHAFNIPKNIYYIPFDICTMFKTLGIDPDINREEYVEYDTDSSKKHLASWDALVIKACHHKMHKMYRKR